MSKKTESEKITKNSPTASNTSPELPTSPLGIPESEKERVWWEKINFNKIGLFILSLVLFIQAITLMKSSAHGLSPLIRNFFKISNAANSLGFGWLFAYTIMSGSPVAAAALTFFDIGVIGQFDTFTMITGSRLGANFIVILIGFLYVLRGRNRATSLSMGVLSLVIAASINLPALLVGGILLKADWFSQIQFTPWLHSSSNSMIEAISYFLITHLPAWIVFFFGLSLSLVSFKLFDQCLPEMTIKDSQVGWMSRLVYRPIVMFFLGALITSISMSVSISLSILVPLSNRGFVRRENVIPYIMGANITTFFDTLLASVLLKNPHAFMIVFVEMLSIMIISLLILMFTFHPYQRIAINFSKWVTDSNQNLAIFMVSIFLIPLILILV